ncbi:hypothetical protein [Streptomyces sp. 8N706]|uniref:hypothetical protein n=1 Tax=Streptomyces sp. 8N706 TaxID=3457416 RepID=UPI003FD452CE
MVVDVAPRFVFAGAYLPAARAPLLPRIDRVTQHLTFDPLEEVPSQLVDVA